MRFSPFKNERHLEIILIGIAIALGALHAWAGRYTMNPDGISYLDMADAFLRRDWEMALSPLWEPLYPFLIALTFLIGNPSPYNEFTAVHFLNFFIYLVTLASFSFFLRACMHRAPHIPSPLFIIFGYALFLVATLNLIGLAIVKPDMIVAACAFFMGGILLRMRVSRSSWLLPILLGVTLGIGYLAKALFFLLTPVVLSVLFFTITNKKLIWPRIGIAFMFFIIIAAPWIAALSISQNRLTYGDAGRLGYIWFITPVTRFIHWQGEQESYGKPIHPTRKIFDTPRVYEFGEPIHATYAPWYNPSYWYEGVELHATLRGHIAALQKNIKTLYDFIFLYQFGTAFLIVSFFLLVFGIGAHLWHDAILVGVPSLFAIGLYTLIMVQTRHVAPFFMLIMMGLFISIRLPEDVHARKLFSRGIIIASFFLMIPFGMGTINKISTAPFRHEHGDIARKLTEIGLRSGDKVATVEPFYIGGSYWARIARVRIVAEIPSGEPHWERFWLDTETQWTILDVFARSGAVMVIAHNPPRSALLDGWQRLDNTDRYVVKLGHETQW